MWHCGRTYFTTLGLLFEIIHGDIGPDIPCEVNENIIDPLHAIKMSSQVIIVFNLGSELLTAQSQMLQEFIRQFDPVSFGEGYIMRIEITRSATKFSGKGNTNELF